MDLTLTIKYVILLILCVISFTASSKTVTIYNPDGTITVCEINEETGTMFCI